MQIRSLKIVILTMLLVVVSNSLTSCQDEEKKSNYSCSVTVTATSDEIYCLLWTNIKEDMESSLQTACTDNFGGSSTQTGNLTKGGSCGTTNLLGTCTQGDGIKSGADSAVSSYYSNGGIFDTSSAETHCNSDSGTWAAAS